MKHKSWREHSRQIIQKIIDDNPGLSEQEQRKLISKSYPYAERRGWAYQSWLAAVKDVFAKQGTAPTPESVRYMWVNRGDQ